MGYKQGKFAFRYANFLGYRKGPDGKPEIDPEEAAVIRMIFQSYLNGDSLQRIKEKLESGGGAHCYRQKRLDHAGHPADSAKRKIYGGCPAAKDVYRQFPGRDGLGRITGNSPNITLRTTIRLSFPGKYSTAYRRKSPGERANIRRPKSTPKPTGESSPANMPSPNGWSAGDCGSAYRRVTWSIHGRRQIVWRCINRIENGPKVCPHSPSIEEETLHSAIWKAIQSLIQEKQEEISAALSHSLIACAGSNNDTDSPIYLQNRLTDLEKEFDRPASDSRGGR